MTILAAILALVVVVVVVCERHRYKVTRRWIAERERVAEHNGNPPMWDWPQRPVDDQPERERTP